MRGSKDRILTTHAGSLPRPDEIIPLIYARSRGEALDQAAKSKIQNAVSTVVRAQAETGTDVISDGELGKSSFIGYLNARLGGFASDPKGGNPWARSRKHLSFPEYYNQGTNTNTSDTFRAGIEALKCTGTVNGN